jgi:hypothetical protein
VCCFPGVYSWFPGGGCAVRVIIAACCVLMASAGSSRADDPREEALKILAKGWGGHGATCVRFGADDKKLTAVAYQFLECGPKAYFFIAGVDLSSDFQSLHTGPLAEGMLKSKDDKSIRWSCTTHDGKTGAVKIGDTKYDLKDGSAFWVFRRGEKWEVYQTKVGPKLFQEQSDPQGAGSPFRLLAAVAKSEKGLAEYAKAIKVKDE